MIPGEGWQHGWVNAHTHLYSGLAPLGMPLPLLPPHSFLDLLQRVWWRLDRALDERSLDISARYYVAQALLQGTTLIVDHHESPQFIEGSLDVLADACQELGIRALLSYGVTERNGGPEEARRGLAECRRFLMSNHRPLVRGLVGLHAAFTVSDETIRAAGRLCRDMGTGLHVHVAEDDIDVRDARRHLFSGPLERLDALEALVPGSILAHGVHLNPHQVRLAMDRGVWLVQNPRSNRGNHVGYPWALRFAERVALGTDGYPSSLPDEIAALEAEASEHGEEESVARLRAENGRKLAVERFGEAVDADEFFPAPAAGAQHVVVGGRDVVRNGVLLAGDQEQIFADAEAEAPRVWKRMAEL